jgi:hypothetical protein
MMHLYLHETPDRLIGVKSGMRAILQNDVFPSTESAIMQARDVMVSPFITADSNATVRRVASLLLQAERNAISRRPTHRCVAFLTLGQSLPP